MAAATDPVPIPPETTGKVPVTLSRKAFARLKKAPQRTMRLTLAVTLGDGQVLAHVITIHA